MIMVRKKDTMFLHLLFAGMICTSTAVAADKVVVVPLGGTVGDATAADVVKGKTFSSQVTGKGVTGTLELPPIAQSHTNSIGMAFNLIPAGTFAMGSPFSDSGRRDTEETLHQVTLTKKIYIQTTEVTNKQWDSLIVGQNLGVNPSRSHTSDDYPVEYVNWFEAVYFANILSAWESRSECYNLTGCSGLAGEGRTCTTVTLNSNCTGYRLPTEAEWEYAARATTDTPYGKPVYYNVYDPTGIVFNPNLDSMGWYYWNRTLPNGFADGTKPVAQKQANLWGLYDMHGNVGEWCHDLWDESSDYPEATVTDPIGDTGTLRVNRGAGWGEAAEDARSAARRANAPDNRAFIRGFRLVLTSGQ